MKYTVIEVRDMNNGKDEPMWFVGLSHDDGTDPHGVAFPHATFHHRVAEYGIDSEDFDTLLDIALHEPYINLHHTDPTFLYNTDRETARLHHLARIQELKKTVTHEDPNSLLDTIRTAYTHDPARVAELAKNVDHALERVARKNTR
jgi:hypothetical protein